MSSVEVSLIQQSVVVGGENASTIYVSERLSSVIEVGGTSPTSLYISSPGTSVLEVEASSTTLAITEPITSVVEVGLQGPAGTDGIDGSGDLHYIQSFINSSFITITHNLNKRPAVTIVDSSGDEVVGDISYINDNSVNLSFGSSFSGQAYCN